MNVYKLNKGAAMSWGGLRVMGYKVVWSLPHVGRWGLGH